MVWCKWGIVRKLASHEPRLHMGKKLEVELGDNVGLQHPAKEKEREWQERILALKHTYSHVCLSPQTFEKNKA